MSNWWNRLGEKHTRLFTRKVVIKFICKKVEYI